MAQREQLMLLAYGNTVKKENHINDKYRNIKLSHFLKSAFIKNIFNEHNEIKPISYKYKDRPLLNGKYLPVYFTHFIIQYLNAKYAVEIAKYLTESLFEEQNKKSIKILSKEDNNKDSNENNKNIISGGYNNNVNGSYINNVNNDNTEYVNKDNELTNSSDETGYELYNNMINMLINEFNKIVYKFILTYLFFIKWIRI